MKRGPMRIIGDCSVCGLPATDRRYLDGNKKNVAAENVVPICRGCLMLADGRMAALHSAEVCAKKVKPARPCKNCGRPQKPLRRGRCHSCTEYVRRNGVERPYVDDGRLERERVPDPEAFWSHVAKGDGCWLWTASTNAGGYGIACYDAQPGLAHRIAWTMIHGPIPDGLFVCHRCDNPPCCNPEHLFLGTPADNTIDAARKGRLAQKMSNDDVRLARALRAAGTPRSDVAARFGVTPELISNIVARKARRHVA